MKYGTETNVPALEVHDLTVAFDRKPVLWNIDLVIPQRKNRWYCGAERCRQVNAHQINYGPASFKQRLYKTVRPVA